MKSPKAQRQPLAASPREFNDDIVDERQYVGRGGFGEMFNDCNPCADATGVPYSTNAHAEGEYEDMRRLPNQVSYKTKLGPNGEYLGESKILSDPPMSSRVRDQVFNSIGDRVGTMTSASLLDRSRGEGDLGNDGGLFSRTRQRSLPVNRRND